MKKFSILVMLFCTFSLQMWAQSVKISGVVRDGSDGSTLPGVSIAVQGQSQGTITDLDGKYSLNVTKGSTLAFSYVGYETQMITVMRDQDVNVNLKITATNINEVVVVGYGTQKAKDLTAPIVSVSGSELAKQTTSNAMQALAGSVAGVQITNNNGGQPGASPSVLIRGLGSINNTSTTATSSVSSTGVLSVSASAKVGGPLYVVDGMFYSDISFLNTTDIESMTILKDASSAAIYGVKAANGVVLITTKKGQLNTNAKITYDGYIGFQTATNVLQMANSQEYSAYMIAKGNTTDAAIIANSISKYGGSGTTPSTNTNWYSQLLRTALTQSHSLDVSGGTEKGTYSLGFNYLYQNGIMNTANNNYSRINLRGKYDYQATRWLKIGFSMVVSNTRSYMPDNSAWFSAYSAPSIFPVYDPNNTNASPKDYADPGTIGLDNSHIKNPVATADIYNNYNTGFQVNPSAYFDINIWKDKLVWHTQYNQGFSLYNQRLYTPVYYVSSNQQNSVSALLKEQDTYNNYVIDNTLTYKDQFGKHNVSLMLGNSERMERWQMLQGTVNNVPGINTQSMYLDQGDASTQGTTDGGYSYNGLSFFARATYGYDSKYLATLTYRSDASSKYPYHPWGSFPSVGLGWVTSNESFMKDQKVFSYLKIRGSWGLLGNDNVPRGGYSLVTTNGGTSAIFGANNMVSGSQIVGFVNPLIWEKTNEWDFGADMNFFNDRLSATFDWYHRTTENGVFTAPIPNTNYTQTGNFANILNTGTEITLKWMDKIGAFHYWIGGNLTTLSNKVQSMSGIATVTTYYNSYPVATAEVGKPIGSYVGYEVAGVYQNEAEIKADPVAVANGLVPGDLRFKEDANGNLIKTTLGSYLPKVTYGINLGLDYKGLELGVVLQGIGGNKIFNYRRTYIAQYGAINIDKDLVTHLWTGEGTSNSYPSAAGLNKPWNQNPSTYYVENGSYIRLQNVQVAYTLKPKLSDITMPTFRFSLTVQNAYTFFNKDYHGFNPDVVTGIDNQVYPMAATYTFGVKMIF